MIDCPDAFDAGDVDVTPCTLGGRNSMAANGEAPGFSALNIWIRLTAR